MTLKRLTIILGYWAVASLGLAACSNDGDKTGSGEGPLQEPRMPVNAVQLTTTNAATVATLMQQIQTPLAKAAEGFLGTIAFGSCVQSSGDDYLTTINDTGTAIYTYVNCISSGFPGYTLSGRLTFSFNEASLSAEHYILSGEMTLTGISDTLTITDIYTRVDNQIGTTLESTVYIAFAVSSQKQGGFTVKTSKPIKLISASSIIGSGELLIQGAGNSKITFDIATNKTTLDSGNGVLTPVPVN